MFIEDLKNSLLETLEKLGEMGDLRVLAEKVIHFEHPSLLEHGDYSSNLALILAKTKKINPVELAQSIVNKWKENLPEFVEKIEVAGNGFINIWLNFNYFVNQIGEVINKTDNYGRSEAKRTTTASFCLFSRTTAR